jgi:hypothetical protein
LGATCWPGFSFSLGWRGANVSLIFWLRGTYALIGWQLLVLKP